MIVSQKKILASALGVFLAVTVSAAKAEPVRYYLGADFIQLKTKIDDKTGVPPIVTGTAKAATLRLKGGAHVLSWLDVELQAVLPRTETYSTAGTKNTAKTSVAAMFAKPNTNLGPVNIYGLLGFSSATVELSGAVSGKKTISGVAYGAGAQFAFTRNFAASIEWTQYNKKNIDVAGFSGGLDANISALGAGIVYTF